MHKKNMENILHDLKSIDYGDIIEKRIIGAMTEICVVSISNLFKTTSKKILIGAKRKITKQEEFEYFAENFDFKIEEALVLKRISYNLKKTNNWAKEIYFNTALSSKELKNIFVEIELYLSPLKHRFDEFEETGRIQGKTLIKQFQKNRIIYGGAGAGKTTFVKKICSEYLDNPGTHPFTCPIVIRFREIDYINHNYGKHFGLFPILIDILGIQITFPLDKIDLFYNEYNGLLKQTIVSFLDECNILLIADGFDEIPNSQIKKRIENDFEELALSLETAKFILTSRNNDFLLQLPNTDSYEICPLNDLQIKKIINNWISNELEAADLYTKIRNSPYYDTTMRPLTLSHLCAIYERKKSIPPKPRYIYDFVLTLLLETWDQQRNIIRPSDYAEFYIEKKKEFLANLAFWFSFHLEKNIFSSDEIRKCYNKIHKSHNLPPSQAKKVVTELESHTGLFIQIGYNSYEFSHKSLQEFLTAKYIYSLPQIPNFEVLHSLPNETAIAICLSSDPNVYFEYLIRDFKKYDEHFWSIFLGRLVDESPDFSENPSVIVFFLIAIQDFNSVVFSNSLKTLLKKTNLNISLKSFFKIYSSSVQYESKFRYTHSNINKALSLRKYFPSVLIIENEINDLIKNKNNT